MGVGMSFLRRDSRLSESWQRGLSATSTRESTSNRTWRRSSAKSTTTRRWTSPKEMSWSYLIKSSTRTSRSCWLWGSKTINRTKSWSDSAIPWSFTSRWTRPTFRFRLCIRLASSWSPSSSNSTLSATYTMIWSPTTSASVSLTTWRLSTRWS